MEIELKLATQDTFYIIENFIPLFRHYIGEAYNELPNKHGVFSYDDSRTLQEMSSQRRKMLDQPKELFPYIIFYKEIPVGYLLVAKVIQPALAKSDYFLNALFLVASARRKGIASHAVKIIFDTFKGNWEVHTSASEQNLPTQLFWNKTLEKYTGNHYFSHRDIVEDGSCKIIFRSASNEEQKLNTRKSK